MVGIRKGMCDAPCGRKKNWILLSRSFVSCCGSVGLSAIPARDPVKVRVSSLANTFEMTSSPDARRSGLT